MKIHYFQRYHGKENVATANTMLLLSRLYSYSPNKFFDLLKSEYFSSSFEPEIAFTMQEKSEKGVPDAIIKQESFKIVVETKLTDWFHLDQLVRHLESFEDEKNKILLTISSEFMSEDKKKDFEKILSEYNKKLERRIVHVNITFARLIEAIRENISENDYEMQNVLEDYEDYCCHDKLITGADAWKYMRMRLAGTTMQFNVKNGVYYDKADYGFRAHDYLALYNNKSIRAVGKVCVRATAVETENGVVFKEELGKLTVEQKQIIKDSMADGDTHGYDLRTIEHRYFFVDKFYETDYKKITPRAPMGTKIFDLTQVLRENVGKKIQKADVPSTKDLAEMLKGLTWG